MKLILLLSLSSSLLVFCLPNLGIGRVLLKNQLGFLVHPFSCGISHGGKAQTSTKRPDPSRYKSSSPFGGDKFIVVTKKIIKFCTDYLAL